VGAVAVPIGVGVDNANAVARSGVVTSGNVVAPGNVASSAAGGVAPIAGTNAPAAMHADTAAGTRDATPSARADAWTGNAAANAVALEWRGGDGESSGGGQRSWSPPTVSTRRRKPPASTGASGRADGGATAPRPGDARRGRSPAGADGAARSTARATGSRRSGGTTRGKRPRPSEGQEVEPPDAAHHKWYRVGSIAPKGYALRAHLSAAAVNRLAAEGSAPAGAVGLAISRVLRSGVDRLHASLRTSSNRTRGEAMDGVVKVVKELRRATHMEDDIDRILDEVRAADRVASAD